MAKIFLSVTALLATIAIEARCQEIRRDIDADFTNMQSSSAAIKHGTRSALSEENNIMGGYPVRVVRKNHQGNSRRSLELSRAQLMPMKRGEPRIWPWGSMMNGMKLY